MRSYQFDSFGLDNLRLVELDASEPGPGEVTVDVHAFSLNYRDLLVVQGAYNPRLALPATPVSDGAGVVSAVGDGVDGVRVGDRVMSQFVADWVDGPFEKRYLNSTLGVPGPGLASERVVLPSRAVVPIPKGYDFAQASTLPIAALTAWSVLVTEGALESGGTVLTLGTGGVSIFALQIARAMGARVIITSSSDDKLARAKQLGADHTINYRENPRWDKTVLELTEGRGADIVVETAGIATMTSSMKAAAAGGVVGVLGGVTGLRGEIDIAPLAMKRLRVIGILVDSRAHFEQLTAFVEANPIEPVIDRRFAFKDFPEALRHMEAGGHFGKIVVEV